ncbi:ABC transporter substrate-binding protein [Billgrantia endophytica]|uniref:Ligand-binding receptor n=1 Tax=Billgrantia endophytica TaxID=2033802 RepID=A0A2N7U6V0_9GAMM|nr:ABC transporter substrate-binding protein [Halomonas endophytica]PMR76160.1 ligand-binding receptor [Halomonas endophytica]
MRTRSAIHSLRRLLLLGACGLMLPAVSSAGLKLGLVAPLSGPASSLGEGMREGIEAHFAEINAGGGVHGRQLELLVRDDRYEPLRSAPETRGLIEEEEILASIGNVGTPTAIVTLPLHNRHQTLLYGAFTGAGGLRLAPPDRYVINYRASYVQETAAMVEGLLEAGIRPEELAFFTQNDGYGDAGYAGGISALKAHGFDDAESLPHGRYSRNSRNIHQGLATILQAPVAPRAIIIVGTYGPAADFIREARRDLPDVLFLNVSFVGSQALLDELDDMADGVIITQVVPPIDADLPAVTAYQAALERHARGAEPNFVSLEGYLAAALFVKGLEAAGPDPDREGVIDALLGLGEVDLGLGEPLRLGTGDHQASDGVWPTRIDGGRFEPVDWENLLR